MTPGSHHWAGVGWRGKAYGSPASKRDVLERAVLVDIGCVQVPVPSQASAAATMPSLADPSGSESVSLAAQANFMVLASPS